MTFMVRGKSPPMTPAERQAACRARKRGERHNDPQVLLRPPTEPLPPMTANPALPAPSGTPALPSPPPPPSTTAIEKSTPADANPPALQDGAGREPADAHRITLPPAVAARLRSLVDRHDAGKPLTAAERAEAQGLLDIAEYFAVQRLRHRLAS